MNAATLSKGDQVTLSDGSLAEVLGVAEDNESVNVRYVDSMDNPEIPVGSVADVPAEEVIALFEGTHSEGAT
ncbi:MAG: hypothetical protein IIC95_01770 [Chloroflexi bacterium]|nr:hypothetical protein [Chloroflexota bacterium]MCH7654697.1 hypothetical protein [Chloroflexota bacterium]